MHFVALRIRDVCQLRLLSWLPFVSCTLGEHSCFAIQVLYHRTHKPRIVWHFHWVKVRGRFALLLDLKPCFCLRSPPAIQYDSIRIVYQYMAVLLDKLPPYINICKTYTHNSPVELIYVKKLFFSAQLEIYEGI